MQQVARRRSPVKRWKSLQLLLMHPRGLEPAAFGFCANEHISHKVKAPRANHPRGLHYLARPRGFEPLAFGFVGREDQPGRRASPLGILEKTRSWVVEAVHASLHRATQLHVSLDAFWTRFHRTAIPKAARYEHFARRSGPVLGRALDTVRKELAVGPNIRRPPFESPGSSAKWERGLRTRFRCELTRTSIHPRTILGTWRHHGHT